MLEATRIVSSTDLWSIYTAGSPSATFSSAITTAGFRKSSDISQAAFFTEAVVIYSFTHFYYHLFVREAEKSVLVKNLSGNVFILKATNLDWCFLSSCLLRVISNGAWFKILFIQADKSKLFQKINKWRWFNSNLTIIVWLKQTQTELLGIPHVF